LSSVHKDPPPVGLRGIFPEGTGMMNQWQYGYRPLALLFADA